MSSASFYRHVTSGETGHLVSREGRDFIRINRPGDAVERVFRPNDWLPEVEYRPLSPMVLARIAYAADRELRVGLGILGHKEWLNLPERDRVAWMERGPEEPVRKKLYDAIMAVVKGLSSGD